MTPERMAQAFIDELTVQLAKTRLDYELAVMRFVHSEAGAIIDRIERSLALEQLSRADTERDPEVQS